VEVVLQGASELGDTDHVVAVSGDKKRAHIPLVRVPPHRAKPFPAAEDGVLALRTDGRLLGLPEHPQQRLVGGIDVEHLRH
jgi:hypothetical protein